MIQTDKEIENRIYSLNYRLQDVNSKLKRKKYFLSMPSNIIILILIILHTCIFTKGLLNYIEETNILLLIALIEFFLIIALVVSFENTITNNLNELENQKINLESKKEKILDFLAYLTACRHLEAIKNGENIYPELYEVDSNWIYNKYKNEFETSRYRYENGERTKVLNEIENNIKDQD